MQIQKMIFGVYCVLYNIFVLSPDFTPRKLFSFIEIVWNEYIDADVVIASTWFVNIAI